MSRQSKLEAPEIDRPMQPGRYGDGGGLYFLVGLNGAKSCVFRHRLDKRERAMGFWLPNMPAEKFLASRISRWWAARFIARSKSLM